MKANEVIKIGRKRARAPSIAALSNPFRFVAFVWQIDDQNGILASNPISMIKATWK
jgi:hypothetical protein